MFMRSPISESRSYVDGLTYAQQMADFTDAHAIMIAEGLVEESDPKIGCYFDSHGPYDRLTWDSFTTFNTDGVRLTLSPKAVTTPLWHGEMYPFGDKNTIRSVNFEITSSVPDNYRVLHLEQAISNKGVAIFSSSFSAVGQALLPGFLDYLDGQRANISVETLKSLVQTVGRQTG